MQGSRGIAVAARRPALLFWLTLIAAVVADQATKIWVRATLHPSETIPLWSGVFHLTFVRNTGAAFGLMPGQRELFMATSLLVIFGVTGFMIYSRPAARWLVFSLGLVAGGAIGNLIDRFLVGRVTDFFDFVLIGFPVFNIADSAIVVGTGMLVVWVLFGPEPSAAEPAGEAETPDAGSPYAPDADAPDDEARS